jgi:predicted MFS family arabinose efflux permease
MGDAEPNGMSLQWIFGTACGALIACLYYAQPVSALIGGTLGIQPTDLGLLVTLPLIGYGIGLITLVPLGDLVENRRVALTLVGCEAVWMFVMSLATQAWMFFAAALLAGVAASAVQILVPYVTYVVAEPYRSRAVGKVVSGLMLGIMLARPFSSLITHASSWRMVFRASACFMGLLFLALAMALPKRQPVAGLSYWGLIRSLGRILADTQVLRRRAFYHACMFGTFTVFWTAVPLWLGGPQFGIDQQQIAWIALAGVAGAAAPPIAARIVDRGFAPAGTAIAMLVASGAFALSGLVSQRTPLGIAMVVISAILLDFAVSAHLTFGQRAIFSLAPELRSRLNGLYIALFFVGGAIGSALSSALFARGGWPAVTALGVGLPLLAMGYYATEFRNRSHVAA